MPILIDDTPFIPRCQKAVLSLILSVAPEIFWASALELKKTEHWKVKDHTAYPILARLRVLREKKAAVYMSGLSFPLEGFDTRLAGSAGSVAAAAPGKALADQLVFLNASGAEIPGLPSEEHGYESCADWKFFEAGELPEGWRYDSPGAKIADCRRIQDRPWLSVGAPHAAYWSARLRGALSKGLLTMEEVLLDRDEGLIRPSLVFELERGIEPAAIPVSVLDLDRRLAPPESRLTPRELRLLRSRRFEWRILRLRLENMYRLKGPYKLLLTLPGKGLKILFKLLRGAVKRTVMQPFQRLSNLAGLVRERLSR